LPALPPLEPEEADCCRFALRFDPFELVFRRMSFQGEIRLWGPLSLEIEPSWIFGSPSENLDARGFAMQSNLLVYFSGVALEGFFLKGTAGFESFEATVTDPELGVSSSADVSSPIFGLGLGSSNLFGDRVAFNFSGGLGVGFATAEKVTITAGRYEVSYYDKAGAIQLLGSIGLGVAF
jgi:hypothetical protein